VSFPYFLEEDLELTCDNESELHNPFRCTPQQREEEAIIDSYIEEDAAPVRDQINNQGFQDKLLSYDIKDFLKVFCISSGTKRPWADILLKFLKKNWSEAVGLPSTVRGLLKTKRNLKKIYVEPGYYTHHGVSSIGDKSGIDFKKLHEKTGGKIILDINADGAEAVKSSGSTMWPLQAKVAGVKMEPVLVGLYVGKGKPKKWNEYFRCFIDEMLAARDEHCSTSYNFTFGGYAFTVVKLRFIMDEPARCDACGTYGATSYNGCNRCEILAKHGE